MTSILSFPLHLYTCCRHAHTHYCAATHVQMCYPHWPTQITECCSSIVHASSKTASLHTVPVCHTQYMLLTYADDLLCLQLHTARSELFYIFKVFLYITQICQFNSTVTLSPSDLCTTPYLHTKQCVCVCVQCHTHLTLTLDGTEQSPSCSKHFNPKLIAHYNPKRLGGFHSWSECAACHHPANGHSSFFQLIAEDINIPTTQKHHPLCRSVMLCWWASSASAFISGAKQSCLNLNVKALQSFKMQTTTCPVMQRHFWQN